MPTEENTHTLSIPCRLSVIISAHNGKDWVERAIRSVISQTDPVGTEVVFVDDGSTDETISFLKGQFFFEIQKGKIKLTEADRCGDVGKLRNHGAACSTGSFLTFLDAKDWWHPGRLAALESWLTSNDLILYTPQTPVKSSDWIRTLLSEPWITTSAVVIRRGLFDDAGGFPEGYSGRILPRRIPGLEDYELWVRAVLELIQVGKKDRLTILKNEHVVTSDHSKTQVSVFEERIKPFKQAVSLIHIAPRLPWRYWPEIAKNMAETGRTWIKSWR